MEATVSEELLQNTGEYQQYRSKIGHLACRIEKNNALQALGLVSVF